MSSVYTLDDFNKIAYEFAIRNSRVIQLLELPLTDDTVKELLTYGIDATSIYFSEDNEEVTINSTQELYLDYRHISLSKHSPHSPYGEGISINPITADISNHYSGHKILVHPLSKSHIHKKENDLDAMVRIAPLIETRGQSNKMKRLLSGEAFKNYDAVTFYDKTIYSLDPTTKTTKTIKDDIKFITEWTNPEAYLKLLPKYNNPLLK